MKVNLLCNVKTVHEMNVVCLNSQHIFLPFRSCAYLILIRLKNDAQMI
jgi:hypothetical protein